MFEIKLPYILTFHRLFSLLYDQFTVNKNAPQLRGILKFNLFCLQS